MYCKTFTPEAAVTVAAGRIVQTGSQQDAQLFFISQCAGFLPDAKYQKTVLQTVKPI